MIRFLVRPDTTAAALMDAICTSTGLAVSESGVLATPIPVTRCRSCGFAHPADLVCALITSAVLMEAGAS